MPRKPAVDPELLIKELHRAEHEILINNKVVGPSSEIWSNIQLKLNIPMTPKAIYTFAKKQFSNKEVSSDSLQSDQEEYCSDSNSTSFSSSETKYDSFSFILTQDEWNKIKPDTRIYKRSDWRKPGRSIQIRKYMILPKGIWTDTLNSAIYSKKRLPCTLIFKRCKIYPNSANVFLRFEATCRECEVKISGKLEDEPKREEDALFICKISGNSNVPHKQSKRRLCGKRREEVSALLVNQKVTASRYRKDEIIKENCNLFEGEPIHLPSLQVLRKAKSEFLNKDRISSDPIKAVELLKTTKPFSNSIRDIGLDKFFVHYWSTNQLRVYNAYCRKTKFPKICLDATGSICKKIVRFGRERSGFIFLYCIVIKITERKNENLIPVAQMLSERHHRNAITYWLKEWIRSGAHPPKECVCDFSLALLSAIAETFTREKSIAGYLNACYKIIFHDCVEIPTCFIRVDVAHVINLVRKWKVFSGKNKRFKELYLRAIGQLVLCSDIKVAENLIKAIIIISQCQSEGISASKKQNSICEIMKNNLKETQSSGDVRNLCDAFIQAADETEVEYGESDDARDCDHDMCDAFSRKIDEIELSCLNLVKDNDDGDRDNLHYCPELLPLFCGLCKRLPLWTNVMKRFFNYGEETASSSAVEAYFGQLKTNLVGKIKPVDIFLREHILANEGAMVITSNSGNLQSNITEEDYSQSLKKIETDTTKELKNETKDNTKTLTSDFIENNEDARINSVEFQEMNTYENWRNLVQQKKIKKKAYYLNPIPTSDTEDRSAFKIPSKIGCLKNGNTQELAPISEGGILFSLTNTCAFDSLIQGLAVSFSDSDTYRNFIKSENNTLSKIVAMVGSGKVTNTAYKLRYYILKNIFSAKHMIPGLQQLDCTTNISHIVANVMPPTFQETRLCTDPSHREEKGFHYITVDLNNLKETFSLKQLITHNLEYYQFKNNCHFPSCNKKTAVTQNVGLHGHIIIEVPDWLESKKIERFSKPTKFTISAFPTILQIQDKEFFLRAILSFTPPLNPNGIGHYKAFCRRINGSWENYDDIVGYKQDIKPSQGVNPHALLYTI